MRSVFRSAARLPIERGLLCLLSLVAICSVPDWLFPLPPLLARSAWARSAAMHCAAGARSAEALAAIAPREQLLFDFGWKFTFGHGADPARDLGFGNGQGDFAKTGDFEFRQGRIRRLQVAHAQPAARLGRRTAVLCATRNCKSHGYKPLGGAIRRPAWAGIGASSKFRPATGPAHRRSSSTAPSATCWSS